LFDQRLELIAVGRKIQRFLAAQHQATVAQRLMEQTERAILQFLLK
jgi:hypothetical protein